MARIVPRRFFGASLGASGIGPTSSSSLSSSTCAVRFSSTFSPPPISSSSSWPRFDIFLDRACRSSGCIVRPRPTSRGARNQGDFPDLQTDKPYCTCILHLRGAATALGPFECARTDAAPYFESNNSSARLIAREFGRRTAKFLYTQRKKKTKERKVKHGQKQCSETYSEEQVAEAHS